jgi:hypothetical protein
MARKFVSPGVFTQEIDQSYTSQGTTSAGAALIGLSLKGPPFAPKQVSDFNEFVSRFGDLYPYYQMTYAAQNYLKNSSVATIVRVLGTRMTSTGSTNGAEVTPVAIVDRSGSMLAEVHLLSGTTLFVSGTGSDVSFTFSGTAGSLFTGTFPSDYSGTFSFDTNATDYIGDVLNTEPLSASAYGHYLYKNFEWAGVGAGAPYTLRGLQGTLSGTISGTTGSASARATNATSSFDYDYDLSYSPVIYSQPFGANGSGSFALFQFVTIAGGSESTTDVKVSIANIKASTVPTITQYGTFDIVVRTFTDSDTRLETVESFSNVNLDPTSDNFLPRVIGDKYTTWNSSQEKNIVNGTYDDVSKYIRVVMLTSTNPPASALPWAHSGYPENVPSGGLFPDVPYVTDNLDSYENARSNIYFGVDLAQPNIADRLKAGAFNDSQFGGIGRVGLPIASSSAGAAFSLAHISSTVSSSGLTYLAYNTASWSYVPSTTAFNGFTVAFYGGWDGFDLTEDNPLNDDVAQHATSVAAISLKHAVDVISNPDDIDINLVVVPNVTAPTVAAYVQNMCQSRADCMYIMDIDGSSVSDVIGQINSRGLDDNYAAAYYPDLILSDSTNNVLIRVKPSVAIIGAYAYSDRVSQVFFAPAGLNRGGLASFNIVDVVDRLTFQDRNDLYEARINPIATFPSEGIVVFGQKTLQYRSSALDRVNVRRLLIYAKKLVIAQAKLLLFEPNNSKTWQKFINTVNPILEKIRTDQGIERFKIVMDSTTNTSDLIDRNIMTGKIFLQPTRTAEFIDLSFIITATGVSFDE